MSRRHDAVTGGPLLMLLVSAVLSAAPVETAAAAEPQGTWQSVSPLATPRSADHSATLLKDGRIIVVGGATCSATCNFADVGVTTAELYDPVAGRWTPTGSTAVPRHYHTATLLRDGRVLVAGGYVEAGGGVRDDVTTAAEVYSPATGRWATAGAMRVGRMGHTATLLPTGRVLVAGGLTLKPDEQGARHLAWESSAELFDPESSTWSDGGMMSEARAEHTATLLQDGTVLVAGGRNLAGGRPPGDIVKALDTAEVYDPAAHTWTLVPHILHSPRADHTATVLPNGSVLLAGGAVSFDHGGTSHPTGSAELYHPTTRTLTSLTPMHESRLAQTAVLLPDGRILITGGIRENEDVRAGRHSAASPELFDPISQSWTPAGIMIADPTTHGARRLLEFLLAGHHTATLLPGRGMTVLVVGGDAGPRSAQLFSLAASGPAVPESPAASRLIREAAIALAVGFLAAIVAWRVWRRRGRA